MSGLSDLQLQAGQQMIFQCLFDSITGKYLCRLRAMRDSADMGERAAALKLLRRAVSSFSWASNRRLAETVVFDSLFERITNKHLPMVQAMFAKDERNEAITLLTQAKSALEEAFREYGWSKY